MSKDRKQGGMGGSCGGFLQIRFLFLFSLSVSHFFAFLEFHLKEFLCLHSTGKVFLKSDKFYVIKI